MDYNIYAGLGGYFGGAQYIGTLRNATQGEAEDYAYEKALDIYDSCSTRGIPSYSDIELEMSAENPYYSPEDVEEAYSSARDEWIIYYAILTEKDDISKDELKYLD